MPSPSKAVDGERRHGQWVVSIKDQSLLVLGAVTVTGIALVAVGWIIQGAAYVPGLLLQLGASMMLLVRSENPANF